MIMGNARSLSRSTVTSQAIFLIISIHFSSLHQITSLKEDKKSKAKSGLKVVVGEIVEKLKKYEESYAQDKQTKAENEQRFEVYRKKMEHLDERLTQLGEMVEAFDDICKCCLNICTLYFQLAIF